MDLFEPQNWALDVAIVCVAIILLVDVVAIVGWGSCYSVSAGIWRLLNEYPWTRWVTLIICAGLTWHWCWK